jgi:hypothetical protein
MSYGADKVIRDEGSIRLIKPEGMAQTFPCRVAPAKPNERDWKASLFDEVYGGGGGTPDSDITSDPISLLERLEMPESLECRENLDPLDCSEFPE